MGDRYVKFVLTAILICLAVIAAKPMENHVQTPAPSVQVDSKNRFVQIAPNVIGVMDTGHNTGKQQLVIFEYDTATKKFDVVSSLEYDYIFTHPEEFGLTIKQ